MIWNGYTPKLTDAAAAFFFLPICFSGNAVVYYGSVYLYCFHYADYHLSKIDYFVSPLYLRQIVEKCLSVTMWGHFTGCLLLPSNNRIMPNLMSGVTFWFVSFLVLFLLPHVHLNHMNASNKSSNTYQVHDIPAVICEMSFSDIIYCWHLWKVLFRYHICWLFWWNVVFSYHICWHFCWNGVFLYHIWHFRWNVVFSYQISWHFWWNVVFSCQISWHF